MESELLECRGINQIIKKMDTVSAHIQDPDLILQIASMPCYKIKKSQIEEMRKEQRRLIINEMGQFKTKVNVPFSKHDFIHVDILNSENESKKEPKFDVGQFLSLFPVYRGI